MVSRRAVIGVVAGLLLVAPACGSGEVEDAADVSASAPAGAPVASPSPASAPVATPGLTAVSGPATVSSTADRVDEPLTVHWIGGSDVEWETFSLPNEFLGDLPDFGERPIVVETRIRQAVMPTGMTEMVQAAIAEGTDAIVMSVNPVWLHWDAAACGDIAVPHDRYACLLTPTSAEVTAQRDAEIRTLIDTAAAAGVPVYLYTQPHSTDVLTNPAVAPSIEAAEAALAAFDPGLPNVRFRSRILTRDLPEMREGVAFFDMVHPTPAGADQLAAWLAADIADFWRSVTS